MSVVGIDLGAYQSVIAVARNRGIDILTNDVSNRSTPALVAYGDRQRQCGEAAKSGEMSNFAGTVGGLKRLLGRTVDEADVRVEQAYVNVPVVDVDGECGVELASLRLSYTQVVATYLAHLRALTAKELQRDVSDVVLSVPAYYTDRQRRALVDAASIAGLNVLRLLNDVTATALQWGVTKTDLPSADEGVRYVCFVDVGYGDMTVQVAAYQRGKLSVQATTWERHLGGREFDQLLVAHFAQVFHEKYKLDVGTNKRALFRLRQACEKVKRVLSANTQAPLNLECLMQDRDLSAVVKREEFEQWMQPLLERMDAPMHRALAMAGITKDDLYAVELVGGTTRIPAVKQRIGDFFGKPLSTTLNQDECIAKGCAFMCAIISPVFKTREFKVEDVCGYGVKCRWDEKEMMVFSKNSAIPATKVLTFQRQGELEVRAEYADEEALPKGMSVELGKFVVQLPQKQVPLKLKVRLNPSGVLEVGPATWVEDDAATPIATAASQASLSPKKSVRSPSPSKDKDKKKDEKEKRKSIPDPLPTKEPVQENKATDAANNELETSLDVDAIAPAAAATGVGEADKKEERKVIKHESPVIAHVPALSTEALQKFRELELSMAANDKLIKDTADKRNALEESVYEWRAKFEGEWAEFLQDAPRKKVLKQLTDVEAWLYGDGEDASKSVYVQKLEELSKLTDPVKKRAREFEERAPLVELFKRTLSEFLTLAGSKDEKYSHITHEERDKVVKECGKKEEWLNKLLQKQAGLAKHAEPVITVDKLKLELEGVKTVGAVMFRAKPEPPKPKPEPPKEEKKDEGMDVDPASPAAETVSPTTPPAEPGSADPKMDVD